jgi:hypothetical protein
MVQGIEMHKPVFTETMQIGIVVRDLDAAIRRYVNDYGIGPWEVAEFNPENAKDLREYGKPVQRSWRLATAMIGHVQWELIGPLDDESICALPCRKGRGRASHRSRCSELRRDAGDAGEAGE